MNALRRWRGVPCLDCATAQDEPCETCAGQRYFVDRFDAEEAHMRRLDAERNAVLDRIRTGDDEPPDYVGARRCAENARTENPMFVVRECHRHTLHGGEDCPTCGGHGRVVR